MTSLGIPASTANEGIPLSARRRHGWIGINEKSIPRAFGNERSMHTMARAFLQTLTGTLRSNRLNTEIQSNLFNFKAILIRKATNMSGPPLNPMVASLSWLLGKWRSEDGHGHYPTIKDFKYIEELEFSHIGQPNIQFAFYGFNFETKKPMHREVGFIRMHPETKKVAFMSAQNTGLAEVEEGELVAPQEIQIQSHTVGRMTFGKEPGVKEHHHSPFVNSGVECYLMSVHSNTDEGIVTERSGLPLALKSLAPN
ncbi:hypothetical protein LSAT2_021544 [Lamellibrachia satsuma]|nr:hypothetical protein LSAT2_021544 [Lamellibrachia satsuma]